MNYKQIQAIYHNLSQEISNLHLQIKKCPRGTIRVEQNGPYTKWFKYDHSGMSYLPKCYKQEAEALAYKKFLSLQLNELLLQQKYINALLKHYPKEQHQAQYLLDEGSMYFALMKNNYMTPSMPAQQWSKEEYIRSTTYPEHLIHKTLKGDYVRSKSEVFIANALFLNKIPYRYECQLALGDILFYPDFTIYDSDTDTLLYWEHFGMMDSSEYRSNAYEKMKIYGQYNIIPSINLLTTYETKTTPLDVSQINNMIALFIKKEVPATQSH